MKQTNKHTLFDRVAARYDLLNHVLSLNIDKWWRKVLLRNLAPKRGDFILDGCAGTCDIALGIARETPGVRVVGVDLSSAMLELGKKKLEKAGTDGAVNLIKGNMLELPFANNTFDKVAVGFGLRNLADYAGGIAEMTRVLKPSGKLLILEFGPPGAGIKWAWYRWYLKKVVPFAGGLLTGRPKNYAYLARSISDFLDAGEIKDMLSQAGLAEVKATRLTGGISLLYSGRKP